MSMIQKIDVQYEDGTTQQVTADGRDLVAFERAAKTGYAMAMQTMTATFFRHIAYLALQRTGALPAQYANRAQFEAACISAEPEELSRGEENVEVFTPADPTNAAALLPRSSGWPASPA